VGDERLDDMIRQDGVDILVDLSQHTGENRLPLFARSPAPVQVSFAGYPETSGVEAIGYRISDRRLEADASEIGIPFGRLRAGSDAEIGSAPRPALPSPISHSKPALNLSEGSVERVFLIDSFWCYDPCGVDIGLNAPPARAGGYVTFGSLNNFCKINDRVLRLWAKILEQVKDSRLVLLSAFGSHRERTLELLRGEGIATDRVKFAQPRPRQDYLELYRGLDLVLDTFPYNGHTTSLDALWMGVPVVSLAGEYPVSRAGLSQLSNLGLSELVGYSEEDFIRIGVELAQDSSRLAELRATLRSRMESSVLMDAPRFARQIETAYRTMWRQWCMEGC
jgi:predicted O-linked N-acetylglucosamine transferase (SPINDLY family)